MSLITLTSVTKEYKLGEIIVTALKDINLDIEKGKFVVLVGPSGSGKTTLLNLISAIDYPSAGRIQIDNVDISFLKRKHRAQFRRDKIGFIFQFFNLLPTLSALENIEFSLDLSGILVNGKRSFDKKDIRETAMTWLRGVHLEERANHFPSQLSGGEQQRVAIARALAKDPPIVVADEPTGNLDYQTGVSILNLMKKLNETTNKTFIVATHNQQIVKIADVVISLQFNQIYCYEQDNPLDVSKLAW